VRADFIAGVVLALIAGSARAEPPQAAGQPAAPPQSSPKAAKPAKAPHAARPNSTPESRSAAALAMSADPVFDEGTYQRIKSTLLSFSAIQVRGGWPTLPPEA
jgi:L,D-transpeptidase YcbB